MHGLGIVKDLIDSILERLKQENLTKITKIYIELGTNSGIDREELDTCFKVLSRGTLMGDCILEVAEANSSHITVNTIEGE